MWETGNHLNPLKGIGGVKTIGKMLENIVHH